MENIEHPTRVSLRNMLANHIPNDSNVLVAIGLMYVGDILGEIWLSLESKEK